MPESEIRATRIFGNDGQFLRMVTPDPILSAVAKIVEHPDYLSIHVPILAIYAVYETPEQMMPRYKTADRETRQVLDQIFDIWQPFAKAERDDLRSRLPGARLVETNGASHYLFISHPETVLREIRAFLQTR
jgi:pimeloyl-ACP methyl ester carboxylesterase